VAVAASREVDANLKLSQRKFLGDEPKKGATECQIGGRSLNDVKTQRLKVSPEMPSLIVAVSIHVAASTFTH